MADTRLHVAIDGRELCGEPTGVGRYLTEVLRAWPASPGTDRLTLIVPAQPQAAPSFPEHLVEWRVEPGAGGTRWEQTRLAHAARDCRPSVFFAPAYTAPLRLGCPSVVTVHDVSFSAHPEWFGRREGLRRRWLTRQSALRAAVVLTVSEFSKSEIVRWLHIAPERIVVAPNGAPAPDLSQTTAGRPPVVLYAGSIFNRRRLPDLIRGFALAAREIAAARLVLIGANRTHPRQDLQALARAAGIGDRVAWRSWVTDDELLAAYREASVFAFLSDYEGFGLTPFEAIAQGAPAVVLDTALSREIYDDGAALVTAEPAAIAATLTRLLTDAAARQALLDAGRRRAARFTWAATAARVRETIARVASP